MTDIPSRLFGSNPSWFFENDTDLLIFLNKNPPFTNQASCTVFSLSSAVSMKVIYVLYMKHFKMGEWLQLRNAGKHVGKMVFLCQTFGIGALAIGCHIPEVSLVTHSLCSLRTLGRLW